MDLSSLNAVGLKKLIKLVESRDGIQAKLVTIEKAIGHALLGSPTAAPQSSVKLAPKKRKTRKKKAAKKAAPEAVKEVATPVKSIKPTRKKATRKKKS